MKKIFGGKNGRITLAAVVILVLLAVTGYWYQDWAQKPENVFNRMLVNSLQTTGYARHSTQEQAGQSLVVDTLQVLAPYHQTQSDNVLTQGDGTTSIHTENIATTDTNYVRYTDIQTDQKKLTGEEFDFSSVLGVWGKAPAANAENSATQLYRQNIVLPIANLYPADRQQLLQQIINDKVYTADFNAVTKHSVDGRQTYTYAVTVAPVPYINMLKTLNSMLGQTQLDNLDPSIYQDTPPLTFAFDVDVLSGQLVKITYQDNNLSENFGSYGARADVRTPEDTIELLELQARLQQLQ